MKKVETIAVVIVLIIVAAIAIQVMTGAPPQPKEAAPPTDPCAEVTCPENQLCVEGECVLKTCAEQGGSICTAEQICEQLIEASDSEACCAVECQAVVDLCEGVECPEGEKCVDGNCVVDLCEGVECSEGQECVEGECVAVEDLCAEVECPEGQQCVDGECVEIEG